MKAAAFLTTAGVIAIGSATLLMGSMYIVDEGRVGVITHMGQAVRQENPEGLKFKMPLLTGVREFDVRERALTGQLSAATSNQLPTTVTFSVNWRPNPEQILEIYKLYGSPDEFAANTIRPRLAQSLKATIGLFTGVQMTREREAIAAAMLAEAQKVLADYPAQISSVQIEDFSLPPRYMEAVLQKEEQREATERERLRLQQQEITSRQAVQTATAEADASVKAADARAYALTVEAEAEAQAIRLRAEAEADGVRAIQEAIAANPLLIEYERAKRWNGQMPTTILGDAPALLMEMPGT